ncbi:TrkA C-terminal domain-containing protein [Cellulosilyticum sp. I15G10I2]|uniref:TrkA C-terminal domain-containing protein n=1 Tax=Cellulosilyticum sp. I15G10I2 TaxID=1892843 RepID=UPI00085CADB8|nr:TrkA C-terminal domain-containing protein [Cellulosilyticum sp. I15G10I2]
MNNSVAPPIYAQIAFDIASRIARGELKENSKISGRSLMSSEYGVSPETIRRSLRLLSDMDIVLVQPNSGAIILSKENANKYMEKFNRGKTYRELKHELKDLIKQRDEINDRILNMIDKMFSLNEKSKEIEAINQYEIKIPKNSFIINKTITDTKFWQNTGATIVGIRRGEQIFLSPGPYAIFEEEDSIIIIGDVASYRRVEEFIKDFHV